ncbi:MAG TPA: ATP synthase subunit I [Pyrinomonadaceae bacterium]|jgi:hypothetical protein
MSEIVNNAGQSALADEAEGAALERRLWRGMCAVLALAVLISVAFAPWRVTTGLILGGILSFFNHHWLRTSLGAVFGGAALGKRPRLSAARYVLRYFVIASIVAAAYRLDLISIAATLVGLCSFAAAIMIEALTQFYFAIVYREDN